jgi:hypothetical protein
MNLFDSLTNKAEELAGKVGIPPNRSFQSRAQSRPRPATTQARLRQSKPPLPSTASP